MKKLAGFLLIGLMLFLFTSTFVKAQEAAETTQTESVKHESNRINGVTLAVMGAIITIVFSGFGSACGINIAAAPAAGIMSENPDMFGKLLLMVVLPGTQGFYGFITGFLVLLKIGYILGDKIQPVTMNQGMQILIICTFQAFIELTSAIYQGKVAAHGVVMTGKKPEAAMKGVIMAVLVETYAVLGLLAGVLGVLYGIKF